MDDLRTIYLLKSLEWEDRGKEKKTLDETDTCNRIAQRYYDEYVAIKTWCEKNGYLHRSTTFWKKKKKKTKPTRYRLGNNNNNNNESLWSNKERKAPIINTDYYDAKTLDDQE